MLLTIEGTAREFTPIKAFREAHDLPPEFGVAFFEPKDYSDLGRIDRAGAELNSVRVAVLATIPAKLPLEQWLTFAPELTRYFAAKLYEINPKVNLRPVEIEFAAAGFGDVCQAVIFALVRARRTLPPPFEMIYGEWLDSTMRVSQTRYTYRDWEVQIVTHAYGRAGLILYGAERTEYVQDSALGCPAEGFMAALLAEVAARIVESTR